MDFDLKNKTADNIVNYNYNETTFYKNQFEKTIDNGGYIQITYPSKSNTPNILSHDLFNGEYITKKLYVIKKIHEIKGIEFDGELIIEHTSLTNNEKPLYSCFLLKTAKMETTNIDTLINPSSDITIKLNDYISSSNAIHYKTKSENILIFTTPILVSSNFDNFQSPKIIIPFSNDYIIVKIKKLSDIEGFKEGIDTEYVNLATYCQPIDEEDPSIGVSTDVIIPADGKVSINKSTTSQITTALNFFVFFILVLFVVIVVPELYRYFIIDLVLENKFNAISPFNPQQLLNRLSAIDIYLGILLFGFSFSLINFGVANNKPIDTIVGFYVFIFFISSIIVLKYKRTFDSEKFLKIFTINDIVPNMNEIRPDIFGLIIDNISQLFIKRDIKGNLRFQFNFIIAVGIFIMLYFILLRFGMAKMTGTSILTYIPLYMFLLSIYIAIYIKYVRDVHERNINITVSPPQEVK